MVRKSKRFLVLAVATMLVGNEVLITEATSMETPTEQVQTGEVDESLTGGEEAEEESISCDTTEEEVTREVTTETQSELESEENDTDVTSEQEELTQQELTEETTEEATVELDEEVSPLADTLEENENEKTYTISELTKTLSWGTEITMNEDGSTLFSFPEQYNQVSFLIPDEVDKTRLEKIICNTSGDTSHLAVKFYGDREIQKETAVSYASNQLSVNNLTEEDLVCFGLMGLEGGYEIAIDSITFVLSEESRDVADEVTDNIFSFDQLEEVMSYDLQKEITEEGILNISFDKKYAEIRYAIPESVDTSKLAKLVLNLKSGDKKTLSLKLLNNYDPAEEAAVGYEVSELSAADVENRSAIKYFGIMGLADEASCEITSVEFVMETDSADADVCIQMDVPDLRDAIAAKTDNEFITGVSITNNELTDKDLMALVTKHFNAVTFGNELKPDCLFGYKSTCTTTESATINGVEIEVPTMDYSRAEKMLDVIYEWNQNHPDDIIRVRGHVLVWHSQTPEWFFHEDYDASKPYVDAETMTLRQEWFIKTVLEHFTGEDSKYKGMFYGWDVVNEAVSDGRGTYRNENENSSWWKVYGNNEFIINAFRFANKYAPADVELYYNDYNEWVSSKVSGIVQLLKDVKSAEGTRIDGMGMQGHYQTEGSPSIEEFKKAAKAYAEIVDKVQITELDMKASNAFDGTSATLDAEYTKQAYRYKDIYEAILELREEGVPMSNMTIWGVIDKNSWLQTSNSVGGAADGTQKQCPLLFDDNYQVKPAYWAFVDETKLAPEIKKLDIIQATDEANVADTKIEITSGNAKLTAVPTWDEQGICVHASIVDNTEDAEDAVTIYLSVNGKKNQKTITRAEAKQTSDGYEADIIIPFEAGELYVAAEIRIDMVLANGENKVAYNDYTMSQEQTDEYYAKAILKPFAVIVKGTATIDGKEDAVWKNASEIPLTINLGTNTNATARLLWDENYLYAYVNVTDPVLNSDSANAHEKDSFEIFIDENHHKSDSYEEDDKQYRMNYLNEHSFNGQKCLEENMQSNVVLTENGYCVEAAFKWTDMTPTSGTSIGLELQINDADASGKRIGTLSWYDTSGMGWSNPSVFGTVLLVEKDEEKEKPIQPESKPGQDNSQSTDQNQQTTEQSDTASNTQTVTQTSKLTDIADTVVLLSASAIQENDSYVNLLFSDKNTILRQALLQKYYGKKQILMAHLGNGIGYSIPIDAGQGNQKDWNLATTMQFVANFAEGFDSFQVKTQDRMELNQEIGMHVNVGSQYAGQQAYIFQRNVTNGMYELSNTMQVNEIGNVAVQTNMVSDLFILIYLSK